MYSNMPIQGLYENMSINMHIFRTNQESANLYS